MSLPRLHMDWEIARLRFLLALMLAAFATLAVALWQMQVARGGDFRRDLARQSVRRVRVPGARGAIVDRQGRPLADNRCSFNVVLYLEELRPRRRRDSLRQEVHRAIETMSAILGLPMPAYTNDLQNHIHRRLPLPFVVWRDLDEAAVARWAEMAVRVAGVDLQAEPVRVYPAHTSACHAVGYVRRAEIDASTEEPYHYHLSEMAGAAGVERFYDQLLRGQAGVRLVRVDAAGYRYDDLGGTDPRPGHTLRLTLDLDVQRAAEDALAGAAGAIVVLDPSDGAVLALASLPGFDPNLFSPSISPAEWARLQGDPATPLLNRATAGAYPPGSTFKPLVAIAALQSGRLAPSTIFSCPGYLALGTARFRCWDTFGHGPLNLSQAIRHSCNVYFFHAGMAAGPEAIAEAARAAGLGQKSGIDLDHEVAGLVPDPAWKRRARRDAWRDGDTCNFSIGQGPIEATPLQMAVVAAAFANGGRRVTPHLLLASRAPGAADFVEARPPPPAPLGWPPAAIWLVASGMRDVVMAEDGTGRRMRVAGISLAGKTGTAEYGPKAEGKKRGWMIAWGPCEQPRFAVAMVVEDAISGGTTVAPRLQKFFATVLAGVPAAPEGNPQ